MPPPGLSGEVAAECRNGRLQEIDCSAPYSDSGRFIALPDSLSHLMEGPTVSIVLIDPGTSRYQLSHSGFQAARDVERCLYEKLFGKCSYEAHTRALMIRTSRVRAFMVDEVLGEAAGARLCGYLPIVTVVHEDGPGVWVFLTRPPAPADDLRVLDRRVSRSRMTIVALGPQAELALPTAGLSRRRWREAGPTAATTVGDFPAYADVIGALTDDV